MGSDAAAQSSQNALVDRLEQLVRQVQSQDSEALCQDLTAVLDDLALQLRDENCRESLGSSLCPLLAKLAAAVPDLPPGDPRSKAWSGVCSQLGRVAANLAAECDVNRERLTAADYPTLILRHVDPKSVIELASVRPVVASLLNLVVERHDSSCKLLAQQANIAVLCRLAGAAYDQLSGGDEEQRDLAASILPWLWSILSILVEEQPEVVAQGVSSAGLTSLVLPLLSLFPASDLRQPPDDLDLRLMADSCTMLERLATIDKPNVAAFLGPLSPPRESAHKTPLSVIMYVLEYGDALRGINEDSVDEEVEPAGEDEEDDDDARPLSKQDLEKAIGLAKASLGRAVVSLSSDIAMSGGNEWFWHDIRRWTEKADRDDLLTCAFLSWGNGARDDVTAREILEGELLLPLVLTNLRADKPIALQHAAVGLLKNLSIPPTNRAILGDAGTMEQVVAMGAWANERDVVKPLQAAAVGVVKNLCRDSPANATRLAVIPDAVNWLLALNSRTDDPAIKMESARIFVNAIRSLASSNQPSAAALGPFSDARVLATIGEMLRAGGPYPVLVNEAIIAFALLVTFAAGETSSTVCSALSSKSPTTAEGQPASPLDVLIAVLRGSEGVKSSPEIRANAVTLLKQLPRDEKGRELRQTVMASLLEAETAGAHLTLEAETWMKEEGA